MNIADASGRITTINEAECFSEFLEVVVSGRDVPIHIVGTIRGQVNSRYMLHATTTSTASLATLNLDPNQPVLHPLLTQD